MTNIGGLGPAAIATMVVETLIAALFLTARFWARIRLLGGLRSDDYFLLITTVCLAIVSILCTVAAFKGFGQHASDLSFAENVAATRLIIISQTFICLCVLFSKVAVADFMLKIVREKWHKVVLWFCIFSVTVSGLSVFVAFYAQCTPLAMIWDPSVKGACHINMTLLGTWNASYTTFMDFLLAGLPWLFLRKLQMKPKEKIVINLSLSVGIFAGICGVIRLTKVPSLGAKSDYTFETVPLQLWSTTETTVSIMCLCFPTFRPLYRRYIKGISKSNSDGPFSSKDRGYQLSGRTNTNFGKTAINTFTVTTGPAAHKHSKQPDNESADSILGDSSQMAGGLHGGIKETRSVTIEYEDGDNITETQSGRSV